MNPALNLKALILNADGNPLSTFPPSIIGAQEAVSAIWRERAVVIENWPDMFFRSPSTTIPVPKTLMLREFANVSAQPKFSRRSIFLRDRYCCQYCGKRFEPHNLTYDHVCPKSAGGATNWLNVVAACIQCNAKKAATMPNYSGRKGRQAKDGSMRPLKEPYRPTTPQLLRAGLEFLPNDIRETWRDHLYWDTELLP